MAPPDAATPYERVVVVDGHRIEVRVEDGHEQIRVDGRMVVTRGEVQEAHAFVVEGANGERVTYDITVLGPPGARRLLVGRDGKLVHSDEPALRPSSGNE